MAQMMWLKRIGWRPARCKGQDWAAKGKATEAGKGGDCRLKKGKARVSATPTPRCCWIRQEIQLSTSGNTIWASSHGHTIGCGCGSSEDLISVAPQGLWRPQPPLARNPASHWPLWQPDHSQQSSLCLGTPGREGATPAPSFRLGLTQKQGLSTRPDPSLVII